MNIPNKHTGPQFDNFGNKVEAKSAVNARSWMAPPTAQASKEVEAVRKTVKRIMSDIERADRQLYSVHRDLSYAFGQALQEGVTKSAQYKVKLFERLAERINV